MKNISSLTASLILAAEVGAVAIILTTAHDPLAVNLGFAVLAGITTWSAIPAVSQLFIKAGLKGMDLSKKTKQVIPESMGMVAGLIYLVTMFMFIPFPFMKWFTASQDGEAHAYQLLTFPNNKLAELLSALLSIQSMVFLGFADDVLDIRWRFKMPLPAVAVIPLLMVYYVNFGVTEIVVPIPLRFLLGQMIDLGKLYYIYMAMVAIFCTHSINIMAGINGVEIGQSLVIAISIALNDLQFIRSDRTLPAALEIHLFSLYFILPFIGVSLGLLLHNWFPARVFVGDTYCYFAGMTFAVVGILAHYSKTLLLFFIPQIFNFLLSAPQLFRLVPCPRHRVPRFNRGTLLMEPSWVVLDHEADAAFLDIGGGSRSGSGSGSHGADTTGGGSGSPPILSARPTASANASSTTSGSPNGKGAVEEPLHHQNQHHLLPSPPIDDAARTLMSSSPIPSKSRREPPLHATGAPRSLSKVSWMCIRLLSGLGLTRVRYDARTGTRPVEMTNLTLLNVLLVRLGPMSERQLTVAVMVLQACCSVLAFIIRYKLVFFFYDVVVN
ncbi:tunicamycin resistance protein [Actinomortierella ambigua]|uniref:UDP-N-acetylglucosamine--dolichyl-phosphate N-acetylglucosaminephosphotransferase n=1 Tax=Actinomortierella ambigua TaxID=1343610 RepID=A0A9P6PZN8_9FUNG|nr:tunicamycin resistance protein [Actinomortierella ambigua]